MMRIVFHISDNSTGYTYCHKSSETVVVYSDMCLSYSGKNPVAVT